VPQEQTVSFTRPKKRDEHLDKQIISAQDCSGSTELFHYHASAIWVTLNYSVIRLKSGAARTGKWGADEREIEAYTEQRRC